MGPRSAYFLGHCGQFLLQKSDSVTSLHVNLIASRALQCFASPILSLLNQRSLTFGTWSLTRPVSGQAPAPDRPGLQVQSATVVPPVQSVGTLLCLSGNVSLLWNVRDRGDGGVMILKSRLSSPGRCGSVGWSVDP